MSDEVMRQVASTLGTIKRMMFMLFANDVVFALVLLFLLYKVTQ